MVADGNVEVTDALSQYGNIEEAINRFGEPYLNLIVWDNNPPFPAYSIAGKYSTSITKLYVKTLFNSPVAFIQNKMRWVSGTLGSSDHLITSLPKEEYMELMI